ncbi:hypothetical protein HG536_0C03780 [Torulaspora globosa]|uniref:Methyl methanesulfonate-sensitivity protein 22 n=1 Tax=Torulaspora globosa TaxID=48254 RepID=A0A7G3ZFC3_9SACH|nr:uncharacterized protein HG536_0C03780 [Torulaspora globosa]QLL32209.1 hypothetical protein HG536_0C03780 [Torulaspora globosa]
MSWDESSSSVVGDSGDDGIEEVIFSPHGELKAKEEIKSSSIWNGRSREVTGSGSDTAFGSSLCDREAVHSNGGRRPYLRKRKAIQKLPYSLERIKHKQLLQGIDISSFDTVSEEVRVPKRLLTVEARDPEPAADETDEWQSQESGSSDSDGDSMKVYIGRSGSLVDSEANESRSRDADNNRIVFRGKMVDVERGYRGVLPRVAWEKSMKRVSHSSIKRRRLEQGNRKGLAKRKTFSSRQSNQDMELMNDLIVPDDEVTEVSNAAADQYASRSAQLMDDMDELQRMSAYYQDKYGDETSSTSSLEVQETWTVDQSRRSSSKEEFEETEIINFRPLSEVVDVKTDSDSSADGGIAAEEDSRMTIDRMLMKRPAFSKLRTLTRSIQPRNRYNRNSKRGGQTKQHVKIVKKRIRREAPSTSDNVKDNAPAEHTIEINHDANTRVPEDSRGKNKVAVRKKTREPFFGIQPKQHSDLSRPVNKFTTVVEGLSRYYAFSPTNGAGIGSENILDKWPSGQQPKDDGCLSTAVDALLLGKDVEIPDIVKIEIADRQFTLSKLKGSNIDQDITEIFDHIIHRGATDKELVEVSESLTAFLLHLNNKGAYEPISKFHKEFRSKVNSLRQNIKIIHFYQIAVCQLMLLEIAKYSSVSGSFKCEIESAILDHIVSFFKLLAISQQHLSNADQHYLIKAYEILAIVIRILDAKIALWQRLENEVFPAALTFILLDVFPIKEAHWGILKFGSDYEAVSQTLAFIHYCVSEHEWQVTSSVVLLIERILRRRRFEDFQEEKEASDSNGVVYSQGQVPASGTVFNKYLLLLRSIKLTKVFIEKIMPMGEISSNDSVSVLINRLNLLIFLAERSDLNSEKRLADLVRPLIRADYLAFRDDRTLQRICQSILNGLLSLLEISCHKRLPFKAKMFLSIFDALIAKNETTKTIFIRFLERLKQTCESFDNSTSTFLKTIYPCFPVLCEQQGRSKERQVMLHIYLKNLETLGPTWVHANLFQTVQKFVQNSNTWVGHYCTIGKFLIEHNVMTWWSFFVYNNIKSNFTGRLEFDQKVTELCDLQSFGLIKRSLFETATASFFQNESILFVKFITTLIDRETGTKSASDFRSTVDSRLRILGPFVSVLKKLCYNDLIFSLIAQVRELYQKNAIQKSYATKIIKFFNSDFVDQIKNSHDFLALKRELGISNEETDKSSFRDMLKLCADSISQACFIESGLIHATVTSDEVSNYLGKLKSLFIFPVLANPFRFFVSLIEAHLTGEREDKFLHIKIGIVAYYLRLINEVLIARFRQVTADEFLEQCRLFKLICQRLPLKSLSKVSGNRAYAHESVRFQIIILQIAQGFSEYDALLSLSKAFLQGSLEDNVKEISPLSKRIDQLVIETAGQTLHVDFDEPKPDYSKLEKLISLRETRRAPL